MKRATASRLVKAGIAIPRAADLRGLGWAAIGAARFAGFVPQKYCHWLTAFCKEGTQK